MVAAQTAALQEEVLPALRSHGIHILTYSELGTTGADRRVTPLGFVATKLFVTWECPSEGCVREDEGTGLHFSGNLAAGLHANGPLLRCCTCGTSAG